MSADKIFQLVNLIALIGWVLLFASHWINCKKIVVSVVVTLLALMYAWLIITNFNPADAANFTTLDGIVHLFANKQLVLTGWVHYLAFDLMTGMFIFNNAKRHNINFWLIVPCLLFTFMLGPIGLLLYLLLRLVVTKKYFASNC